MISFHSLNKFIIADVECLPSRSNSCVHSGTISIGHFFICLPKPYFSHFCTSYNILWKFCCCYAFSLFSEFSGYFLWCAVTEISAWLFLWSVSDWQMFPEMLQGNKSSRFAKFCCMLHAFSTTVIYSQV